MIDYDTPAKNEQRENIIEAARKMATELKIPMRELRIKYLDGDELLCTGELLWAGCDPGNLYSPNRNQKIVEKLKKLGVNSQVCDFEFGNPPDIKYHVVWGDFQCTISNAESKALDTMLTLKPFFEDRVVVVTTFTARCKGVKHKKILPMMMNDLAAACGKVPQGTYCRTYKRAGQHSASMITTVCDLMPGNGDIRVDFKSKRDKKIYISDETIELLELGII